ncbi:MAG: HAMP domain-containing histidine kinase [Planctomycetales bacterium]|nr:HAMP domain-containing histidine kinase [Planctomycetales bacterium]
MSEPHTTDGLISEDTMRLDRSADLQAVLEAWHAATLRLEKTHVALQEEVSRLTTELEKKNRELARKNRLADLGQMASHVAHEVRNNLVPVSLYLSLLKRRLDGDDGHLDVVAKIETGLTSLDTTVSDLLHFTSEREPQCDCFDVRELVDDICDTLAPQFAAQGIEVELDVPNDHRLFADRHMLRRAVMNLVINAIDAMPDGGELLVTSVQTADGVEIEVADSGDGLADDTRSRAFEPFFTTKATGTGLGLAIVERVADAHGGCISSTNCAQGGAAFTLRIPTQQLASRAAA